VFCFSGFFIHIFLFSSFSQKLDYPYSKTGIIKQPIVANFMQGICHCHPCDYPNDAEQYGSVPASQTWINSSYINGPQST